MRNQGKQQNDCPTVPPEYGGKWIAWNSEGTRILASGDDADAVMADALASGESEPIVEKVPPSDALLAGGA